MAFVFSIDKKNAVVSNGIQINLKEIILNF